VLIFDTETTDATNPHLIEAAYIVLSDEKPLDLRVSSTYEQRFNPGVKSSLGALATHNILDSELTDCPTPDTFTLPDDTTFIIGHNIDFDWKVIGEPDVKRIDTLCLVRNVLPNLDSHKLGACLYHFMGDDAKPLVTGAHGALNDCEMVRHLLRYIVPYYRIEGEFFDWAAMWAASEFARVPSIMAFGKHKGTSIKDLPADYVKWLKGTDIDPYLRKALG
jgi:exodeoxyribonuclease X